MNNLHTISEKGEPPASHSAPFQTMHVAHPSSYEENLVQTMYQYSNHPRKPLSELEVCVGSIIGKNGMQSKRQREESVSMKDKHERDVTYIVKCIREGYDSDEGAESLERSMACLSIAANGPNYRPRVGTLVSFGWIAAAICLQEVEIFQMEAAGLYSRRR
jgi:hypothetical protein